MTGVVKPTINTAIFLIDPTAPTHREKKRCSHLILLPTGSRDDFALCCSFTTGSLGICTAASYRVRRFTHIIVSAVEIVSTVHSDVKRMHLSPAVHRAGFGEVT